MCAIKLVCDAGAGKSSWQGAALVHAELAEKGQGLSCAEVSSEYLATGGVRLMRLSGVSLGSTGSCRVKAE